MPKPAISRPEDPLSIAADDSTSHRGAASRLDAKVSTTAAGSSQAALSQKDLHRKLNAEDGTRQLLVSGFWIAIFGAVAMLPVLIFFGGVGPQGAHSNAGWLSLMISLMSEPFGVLLLALGGAKWLRNRSISRRSF